MPRQRGAGPLGDECHGRSAPGSACVGGARRAWASLGSMTVLKPSTARWPLPRVELVPIPHAPRATHLDDDQCEQPARLEHEDVQGRVGGSFHLRNQPRQFKPASGPLRRRADGPRGAHAGHAVCMNIEKFKRHATPSSATIAFWWAGPRLMCWTACGYAGLAFLLAGRGHERLPIFLRDSFYMRAERNASIQNGLFK